MLFRHIHHGAAAQVALLFGGLFAHQVPCVGASMLDLAGTGHLETLLGAGMGFHLRHNNAFYQMDRKDKGIRANAQIPLSVNL